MEKEERFTMVTIYCTVHNVIASSRIATVGQTRHMAATSYSAQPRILILGRKMPISCVGRSIECVVRLRRRESSSTVAATRPCDTASLDVLPHSQWQSPRRIRERAQAKLSLSSLGAMQNHPITLLLISSSSQLIDQRQDKQPHSSYFTVQTRGNSTHQEIQQLPFQPSSFF